MDQIDWQFRPRTYPHFDHSISQRKEALTLISNFQKSGQHSFLPFLESPLELRRFSNYLEKMRVLEAGGDGSAVEVNKPRPIKYAAHQDSQLFSFYRAVLAANYENVLIARKLQQYPTAYRKIPTSQSRLGGKCNIHYAKEAFDEVVRQGECVVITLDVKGFFESLDHAFLKQKWLDIMQFDEMPQDHNSIFKAITDYSLVDKEACYEQLGLTKLDGSKRKFLQCPFFIFRNKKMLCDKDEYRRKIVGAGLVQKNTYGGKSIPQGIP